MRRRWDPQSHANLSLSEAARVANSTSAAIAQTDRDIGANHE
jgi:hypothetical protein